MKEKINKLAKGIFEYHTPEMIVSTDQIDISVEVGKIYTGSFVISSSDGSNIKGIIYSTNRLMVCDIDQFSGDKCVVNYTLKSDNLDVMEAVKGSFNIISNYDEVIVKYKAKVKEPYCLTTLGKLKDLFHFANLAKSDWHEAVSLFKSEEFRRVFLYNEQNNKNIYEKLIKSRNINQAMEEFLIISHKKHKINISVDKTHVDYNINKDIFMDKILVSKDNWGYTEIRVKSDSPFIRLERKKILGDNFIGTTYQLEYIIDPDYMRIGNNYGQIILKTVNQRIVVKISCKYTNFQYVRDESRKELKRCTKLFTENYLKFRVGKFSVDKYISLTTDTLNFAKAYGYNRLCDLVQIHLGIISGREEETRRLLERLLEDEKELKVSSPEYYAAFCYLNSLYHKDKQTTEDGVKKIGKLYEKDNGNWKLFWFLLYLDENYEDDLPYKYQEISRQFVWGCISPVIYYEACAILNERPLIIDELNRFELQFIYWGVKMDLFNSKAISHISYLAGRMKNFNSILFKCLTLIYKKNPSKEILSVICGLLIKGHQIGKKYFKWFKLGVEQQLRITELYEYYMYSLNEEEIIDIDQNILLYFIYNSNLQDKKKAYLYANIISQRESNPAMYRSYLKHMEQFMLKQIELKNISKNLAVIYENLLSKEMISLNIAKNLPFILFKYQIICDNPNVTGVYVIHDEVIEEQYVPLIDSIANIDIFTDNYTVLLVDNYENRYISTIEYKLHKYMRHEEYLYRCYDLNLGNNMLLLHFGEKAQLYQRYDDKSIEARKQIVRHTEITKHYMKNYLISLIDYYYDNYEGEVLEDYLLAIDLEYLNTFQRNKIIEIMMTRKLYKRSLAVLEKYGFEKLNIKKLFKFCSRIIRNDEDKLDIFILSIAHHVFSIGKIHDVTLIKYLSKYYNGTTKDMFEIWSAAKEIQIDSHELEERLLAQSLFSEYYIEQIFLVFISYYNYNFDTKICKAFLTFYAYKYLVKERIIKVELFPYIRKAADINEICKIAILKYYSQLIEINEEDKEFIEKNLEVLVAQGMIFPFFKNFVGKLKVPYHILDKIYVEYIGKPSSVVHIHYISDSGEFGDSYTVELMKDVFYGIHVKEFMLFYNEGIQYYISVKTKEEADIDISAKIEVYDYVYDQEEKKYDMLNMILVTREMQDDTALIDSMETYAKNNYIVQELFKPL